MTPTQARNLSKHACSPSRQSARLRNLRLRPPKPALGRGRLQGQIRRAFLLGEELSSSQIYDWCYVRHRRPLTTLQRYSVWRLLAVMCEPVGRAPTIGRPWLWRLKGSKSGSKSGD
jgi:hypothetical protein